MANGHYSTMKILHNTNFSVHMADGLT